MAKMGNITMQIDKYFIQTRIPICLSKHCKHNMLSLHDVAFCNLKTIEIGKEGNCLSFEERKKDEPSQ